MISILISLSPNLCFEEIVVYICGLLITEELFRNPRACNYVQS